MSLFVKSAVSQRSQLSPFSFSQSMGSVCALHCTSYDAPVYSFLPRFLSCLYSSHSHCRPPGGGSLPVFHLPPRKRRPNIVPLSHRGDIDQ